MTSPSHKKIKTLYAQSLLSTLQAIMVFIAALFTTALLPSLVVRFFFSEQDLFSTPPIVEYIPVASFVISSVYFLYVIVANFRRGMNIKSLSNQAEIELNCCGGDCGCDSSEHDAGIDMSELKELEEMVDAALESKAVKPKKTTRRKKVSKTK